MQGPDMPHICMNDSIPKNEGKEGEKSCPQSPWWPSGGCTVIFPIWLHVNLQNTMHMRKLLATQVQLREKFLPSLAERGFPTPPAPPHAGFQNCHLLLLWNPEQQELQSQQNYGPCPGDQMSGRAGEGGTLLMGREAVGCPERSQEVEISQNGRHR